MPPQNPRDLLKRCTACCKQKPVPDYAGDSTICRDCEATRRHLSRHRAATQAVRSEIVRLATQARTKAAQIPTLDQLAAQTQVAAQAIGETNAVGFVSRVWFDIINDEHTAAKTRLDACKLFVSLLQQTEAMAKQGDNLDALGDQEIDERFADLVVQMLTRTPSLIRAVVTGNPELGERLMEEITAEMATAPGDTPRMTVSAAPTQFPAVIDGEAFEENDP